MAEPGRLKGSQLPSEQPMHRPARWRAARPLAPPSGQVPAVLRCGQLVVELKGSAVQLADELEESVPSVEAVGEEEGRGGSAGSRLRVGPREGAAAFTFLASGAALGRTQSTLVAQPPALTILPRVRPPARLAHENTALSLVGTRAARSGLPRAPMNGPS